MEKENFTLTDEEINQEISHDEETEVFEISDEAKEQSKKFFNFGHKPKKPKRKFESFEIVKTYTHKEKPKNENEFDKILEVSNGQSVDEETVSIKSSQKKQNVKLKVRPQGKLILAVISVIIILLSSLTIYNAVNINRISNNIESLNNQITVQDLNIDKAIKNLKTLNEDAKSSEQALNLDLEKAEEVMEVTLYERNSEKEVEAISNWFDKLCNFISKIFGG